MDHGPSRRAPYGLVLVHEIRRAVDLNIFAVPILYAAVDAQWGWAGPVILTSLAIAATVAIFVYFLSAHFEAAHCILLAMLALLLSQHHFLARPHVLAMPMMVAWVGGMISAADRRAPPSSCFYCR